MIDPPVPAEPLPRTLNLGTFAVARYNWKATSVWSFSLGNRSMTLPYDASWPRRLPADDAVDLRRKLVERVRREIQLGIYETEEKLAIALDRLIEEVESREAF
jgi:hypothetical protein